MATIDDVARIANELPDVTEGERRGDLHDLALRRIHGCSHRAEACEQECGSGGGRRCVVVVRAAEAGARIPEAPRALHAVAFTLVLEMLEGIAQGGPQ
jgi:hypothetical protein